MYFSEFSFEGMKSCKLYFTIGDHFSICYFFLGEDKNVVNVLIKQLNNLFDQVKWHPWSVDFVAMNTVQHVKEFRNHWKKCIDSTEEMVCSEFSKDKKMCSILIYYRKSKLC